ncbi:putative holin-like toxin [Streptococcus suis]|nr:putative holin-like toxin [Streptococcus suis]
MTVSEALQLMLSFGHIVLTLMSVVISLITLNKKK